MERSSSMVSWCTVSSLLYWAWKSTLSGTILWRWKNNRQLFIFVLDFGRKLWSVNSQPNPEVRKTNWTKRVVYYILSGTHQVVVIHFWSNHRGQVFWENQFFLFWGDPKNFFDPQKPYLALETQLLGGSYSKTFHPCHSFGDIQC